jgi:hypothetical protein
VSLEGELEQRGEHPREAYGRRKQDRSQQEEHRRT